MNIMFNICTALSAGLIIGVLVGAVKAVLFHKMGKTYSQNKIESTHRFLLIFAAILKYATFVLLVIGFVWCVYFLALGIFVPEQADYANNISELIVAVLTVISILFAFIEFISRKNDGK